MTDAGGGADSGLRLRNWLWSDLLCKWNSFKSNGSGKTKNFGRRKPRKRGENNKEG
jgi:hypothetical protein